MSANCQTYLQTILQAMSRFSGLSSQITRGDYRVLDSGGEELIVIRAGTIQGTNTYARYLKRTWIIPFDVFHKYSDNGTSDTNFTTLLDAILAQLDSYPTLNQSTTFTLVEIGTNNEPFYVMDSQNAGPFFIGQTLTATITEVIALSAGEYT